MSGRIFKGNWKERIKKEERGAFRAADVYTVSHAYARRSPYTQFLKLSFVHMRMAS